MHFGAPAEGAESEGTSFYGGGRGTKGHNQLCKHFSHPSLYVSAMMPLAKANLIAEPRDRGREVCSSERGKKQLLWNKHFLTMICQILYLNTMDYALSECFQFQVTENGTQINLNKKRLTDSGLKKKNNR